MFLRYLHPYYSPDGPTGGGAGTNSALAERPSGGRKESFDDDTDALNDLMDNRPAPAKKEVEEEQEPEEDLLLDTEEEPEAEAEGEEEDEDLITPEVDNNRGIDLVKIKEKYPEFAKTNEFRELRNAYHREAQYTNLFPTLDDAKDAAENNETFNKLNAALVGRGDVSVLFKAVTEADPNSMKKIATSFLGVLNQFDNNLYVETITPVIKTLAKNIKAQGEKYLKRDPKSADGEALIATARNIMQYAFDDAELIDKEEPEVPKEVTERERKIAERENALRMQDFHQALGIATTSVDRHLDKIISEGLDPDGRFNEFTKDTLMEKIKNEVKNQVSNDQLHVRRMNSLWKRAEEKGYNRETLSRIVAAYLERARAVIPATRNKYKGIALKGRQNVERDDNNPEPERNRNIRLGGKGASGRPAPRDGRAPRVVSDTRKIDYRNTTDDDIFNGNVKLKGK